MQTPIGMAYQDLANAIVVQAAEDYRNALKGISYNHYPAEIIIERLEKFFKSDYFGILTRVDGEYLLWKLKEEHRQKERCKND